MLEWTESVYASVYLAVVLVPLVARSAGQVRRFAITGYVGAGLGFLVYLVVPLVAVPKEFEPSGWAGHLLMLERADGLAGRAAFPSFHVFWACAAAYVWTWLGRWPARAAPLWLAGAAASCATTGMHSLADVAGGLALFLAAAWAPAWWNLMRRCAERVANSWREWRIGPVRIINHGVYAGAAAFAGVLISAALAGPEHVGSLAVCAGCGLLGAAMWGQALTGSRVLLRPFGYFGFVLGAAAGLVGLGLAGLDLLTPGAAIVTGAPWAQAIGRARCLVQGCCHGAPCGAETGIVYTRPQSRVVFVAGLGGVPVHPTPLYSIAGNVVIALLLARLWSVHVPATFIGGAYLILAGLLRFVEESVRGEPQTPTVGRLRIYQVLAIASVVAGMAVSAVPSEPVSASLRLDTVTWVLASASALVFAFAMGIDFPRSSRRFARLA